MTVYFAIDNADGLTLPNGEIVGMSFSEANLRANGFDASTYNATNNRLAEIEDDDNGFNSNCEPRLVVDGATIRNGWYWINGETKASIPPSDLDDLKQAIRTYQRQVVAWNGELVARGVGQPIAKVQQGHNRLYSSLGYIYVVCRNSSHSLADRKILVANMTTGANDIRKVDDFYTEDTGAFAEPGARGNTARDWYSWVDISDPSTKLNLTASVSVSGAIATDVNLLGDDWVAAIAS